MTEQECLDRMVAPGTRRPGKYREGVVQLWVTRACDKACFGCTQGSNLLAMPKPAPKEYYPVFMPVDKFEQAVLSLKGYFGVVGLFGGNPATHPDFAELCQVLRKHVPYEQRGIWCNNPITIENARLMRETYCASVSNLNVHLDRKAYDLFQAGWPESRPVGLDRDSRHSPPFVAMRDILRKDCQACDGEGSKMYQLAKERCVETGGYRVAMQDGTWFYKTGEHKEIEFKTIGGHCAACQGSGKVYDESKAWELISRCDINQHWSAMIGLFRGELRAWFCEVAGAQAMLHQYEEGYPDTGLDPTKIYTVQSNGHDYDLVTGNEQTGGWLWWQLSMKAFASQVRKHCHECGVPLRGYGELAQAAQGCEQTSETHANVYFPKRRDRPRQVVTDVLQLGVGRLAKMTDYLGNAVK